MSRKGIGMMTAIVAAMGITGSTRPGVYSMEPTATVKRTGRTYYSGWYPSTLGRKGVRGKSAPNNRRTTKLARASRKRNGRRA